MNERETAQAINDRAAEWVARLDAGALDQAAQDDLDRWLAGDERRRGAFFRAQVAWRMLDRASVMGGGAREPGDGESTVPADLLERRVDRRRAVWAGGAIAASVAAMVLGLTLRSQPPEQIETALGEMRRVPLQDGSLAAVNTDTKLAVDLQPNSRNVRIDQGEAWFQVAKDKTRPFVVAAGDVRVRAVGTAFSVRRLDEGADVQVTEGVVEVWTVGREANLAKVSAGTRTYVAYASGSAASSENRAAIDRTLSWRDGQLVFDGDTLGDAAAEFNRYNAVKISVAPELSGEKVVGRFRTNEPEAFARAASIMFDAQVRREDRNIELSRK
jgi:transmembrane sensor